MSHVSPATLALVTTALAGLQALLMAVDELWYHRRRGLSVLEAVGHPIDSLVFLAAIAIPATTAPSESALGLFALLAVASAVIITKDEGIHARDCLAGEHWLHAMLFVVHAPLLIALGLLWTMAPDAQVLRILPWPVLVVMLFQIVYWVSFHVQRRLRQPGQQRLLRHAWRPLVR